MKSGSSSTGRYQISRSPERGCEVRLVGPVTLHTAGPLLEGLKRDIPFKRTAALAVNLDQVSCLDEFGGVALLQLKRWASARQVRFRLVATTPRARELAGRIRLDDPPAAVPPRKRERERLIIRLGGACIRIVAGMGEHMVFLGSVMLALGYTLMHPRSLRVGDTLNHMERTGVDALPIVATISYLLGLIMAFVSALQLRPFGANIYVASLVVLAMVSELGPIMTAIVVAGRSGSAFAAEIGTMKISEEVDALFVMGFDPALFVTVPRIVACLVVVPVLTVFADLFAIAGGLTVGVFMLDLTPGSYISQTLDYLTLQDIAWGVSKSVVFAFIISWVACLRGFQVRGGASAVGGAATSAVVSGIFLIILFDSLFAVIRSYW